MEEFEEKRAPRWVRLLLSLGSGLLFAAGLFIGLVLREVLLGSCCSHWAPYYSRSAVT